MTQSENVVGAIDWRLKGPRYRLEPQKRPIALHQSDPDNQTDLAKAQERIRREGIIYTTEMLLDQYGDERLKFEHIQDLKKILF